MDRVPFVVVAKSPMPRIREFAKERGWTNLRLVSAAHNTDNLDYHGELKNGSQMPLLNVFVKLGGAIHTSTARNCCTLRSSQARMPGTSISSGHCGTCSI
jgi:predicted dithiol-disulfide oxidoreductase (DUF899 family)